MTKILFAVVFFISVACKAQLSDCKLIYAEEGIESAYPRISNNKKTILFQSDRSGTWHLYLFDISTKKLIQLTTGESNNNFPDWSADNEWIAFVSDRNGNEELYLMRTDGTELKRLTEDLARDIHPYFSPDGKYILFNSTRGNGSLDIYRYALATNKIERLTQTEANETCARYSPDMSSIVFLRNDYSSDDIYTLYLSNFLTENITKTPNVTDGWPAFSPDGKWIYYSSMESGTYCLYRIKTDGSDKEKLSEAPSGEEHARINLSADGKLIIYNRRIGKTIEIWSCEK